MLSNRNIKYFKLAKNVAELSDFSRCRVGCVVIYNGKVLNSSFNCNKTHPLQKVYNQYRFSGDECPHKLHAEIHALIPFLRQDIDWGRVSVYVYRIRKDIGKGIARPCEGCMEFIKSLGIKDIYYTTNDGYCHEEIKY